MLQCYLRLGCRHCGAGTRHSRCTASEWSRLSLPLIFVGECMVCGPGRSGPFNREGKKNLHFNQIQTEIRLLFPTVVNELEARCCPSCSGRAGKLGSSFPPRRRDHSAQQALRRLFCKTKGISASSTPCMKLRVWRDSKREDMIAS